MKIGIISDTHLTKKEIKNKSPIAKRLFRVLDEIFTDVDLIIHCGDVTEDLVLDVLNERAPIINVKGNCDRAIETRKWKDIEKIHHEDHSIVIAHNREN